MSVPLDPAGLGGILVRDLEGVMVAFRGGGVRLFLAIVVMSVGQLACASAKLKDQIVDTKSRQAVEWTDLQAALAAADHVVVGEKHYTADVQKAEASLMEAWAQARPHQKLVFGWEFLAHTQAARDQALWDQVIKGELTVEDFLKTTQGQLGPVYAPVLDQVLKHQMELRGLNLTRSEKRPVTQAGLGALDPKLLPPEYARLGANYLERFRAIMAGHVSEEQLDRFYEAQCLTDDVMAFQAVQNHRQASFMIAGSFHVDYRDGVVERLRIRSPQSSILTIRILDQSDFKEDEIESLVWNPKYGEIADYVLFLNEPK